MDVIKKQVKTVMLALFALSSLSLAACETIEGAGRDIEDAGEAIQKKADD